MMYMIVTGLDPFNDTKNQIALAAKVMSGQRPPIPDWVPECYRSLIEQCWQTKPEDRLTFKEVLHQLGTDDFLDDDVDADKVQTYQARVTPGVVPPRTKARSIGTQREKGLTPIETLRLMADAGQAFACVQFGQKLQKGDGIEKNEVDAAKYFQRAADEGNVEGIVCLGKCYCAGVGVPWNLAKAAELFKQAADRHDIEGLYEYAYILHYSLGANRDWVQAAALYKRAADRGHVLAQCRYGEMIERSEGMVESIMEAVRYYRMSAGQACREAMFKLAEMSHQGR
jgi:hypothetical protein